jgi:hypothetical protein
MVGPQVCHIGLQANTAEISSYMIWQSYWKMYKAKSSAPAQPSRAVRDVLSNIYHEGWIGWGGPTAWPPRSTPYLNPLVFYPWGHLNAAPVDNEEALHHRMPVRLSATVPASLNGCGGPWDVSRRALNLMEDILSAYYKRTLSGTTHKSNVSGHMSMWTSFLVLVCGTRAQSLSAHFSYTLYSGGW